MTSTSPLTDLVILGGGCAGLSLAARLADRQRETGSGRRLRVEIIEPRREYADDRSWCFWRPEHHDLSHLVSHSWEGWRFSGEGGPVFHHRVRSLRYHYVRGADFYADARRRIEAAPDIQLKLGTAAEALVPVHEGGRDLVRVETSRGSLLARHVVDTRPRAMPAMIYQSFRGVEIESDDPLPFDLGEVGLMEAMAADPAGMRFRYTLPLTPTRALVEWTRFSAAPVAASVLDAELDEQLALLGVTGARVIRREGGVLPMSTRRPPDDLPAGVVTAGTSGGALRAASGYGFLRMQNWARACALQLHRGGPPLPHPPEPPLRRTMDRIFLQTVVADISRTPEYFLALAGGVQPAALERFLSDSARVSDYVRLIAALPTVPFLQQLAPVSGRAVTRAVPA
jgi:lycopene beta-cyclase